MFWDIWGSKNQKGRKRVCGLITTETITGTPLEIGKKIEGDEDYFLGKLPQELLWDISSLIIPSDSTGQVPIAVYYEDDGLARPCTSRPSIKDSWWTQPCRWLVAPSMPDAQLLYDALQLVGEKRLRRVPGILTRDYKTVFGNKHVVVMRDDYDVRGNLRALLESVENPVVTDDEVADLLDIPIMDEDSPEGGTSTESDHLITSGEVADMLGISMQRFYGRRHASPHLLPKPCEKRGRHLYWRRADVEEFVNSRRGKRKRRR